MPQLVQLRRERNAAAALSTLRIVCPTLGTSRKGLSKNDQGRLVCVSLFHGRAGRALQRLRSIQLSTDNMADSPHHGLVGGDSCTLAVSVVSERGNKGLMRLGAAVLDEADASISCCSVLSTAVDLPWAAELVKTQSSSHCGGPTSIIAPRTIPEELHAALKQPLTDTAVADSPDFHVSLKPARACKFKMSWQRMAVGSARIVKACADCDNCPFDDNRPGFCDVQSTLPLRSDCCWISISLTSIQRQERRQLRCRGATRPGCCAARSTLRTKP